MPSCRDCDRVLEMRRQRPIGRSDGPTIGHYFRLLRTEIQHWLNGQRPPGLHRWPGRAHLVVRDLRGLVHAATDPVAHVLTYDSKSFGRCVLVDGGRDVVKGPLWANSLYSPPERFACSVKKF